MHLLKHGRVSSVSIGTRLRAVRPGFDFREGEGIFLFVTSSRQILEPTQPLVKWVPVLISPEVKRLGRETDNPPPPSAEVKSA
jgi:hypothetical protein